LGEIVYNRWMLEKRDAQDNEAEDKPTGDSVGGDKFQDFKFEAFQNSPVAVGGNVNAIYDQRTYIQSGNTEPLPEGFGRFTVPFSYPDEKQFFGRSEELASLHNLLQKENQVGIRPAGLTGMGGIGKTHSSDRTLKIWNISTSLNTSLATGTEERTLAGHSDWVRAVAITPDGQRAVSASEDRTLKVWNLETGEQLASITLDGPLQCVAITPEGVTILTGDQAGGLYCFRYIEPP